MEGKIWKPIPNIKDYEISNQGGLRKWLKNNDWKYYTNNSPTSKYIKNTINGEVHLRHRLVAQVFIGHVEGMVVHHINEKKDDNRVKNLEILTHEEHLKVHGTRKLDLKDAREIRRLFFIEHYNQSKLASIYDISLSSIRYIIRCFKYYEDTEDNIFNAVRYGDKPDIVDVSKYKWWGNYIR